MQTSIDIALTLTNPFDYNEYKSRRNRSFRPVNRAEALFLQAVLDIEAKGNAQSLADEISTKNFDALRVNVTGASSNTIEVSIGR